jgi:release factor glutamine methyltransferase
MGSIGNFLKDFFHQNESALLKDYPGLNLEILKKKFFEFAGSNYLSQLEFYSSPKWWPETHKNEYFFKQLKDGKPFQYILGETFFYKYNFNVDTGVFIPRPETEILVEMGIAELKKIKKTIPKVLDLGTGTGAIVISLGEIPCEAEAFDQNPKAIEIAEKNFFKLKFNFPMQNKINFINSDFFENDSKKFDLVISNPPYIKKVEDYGTVHDQVKRFEPDLALFIEDDEYEGWFSRFLNMVYLKLEPNGVFLMEGHENHLKNIQIQAQTEGFLDIMVLKDLTGRDRFIRARKNG